MSISINHHREGQGPELVLLHGVGHHWQAWRPVIDLLAGEFDVIACDSPGFGRSAPLPAGIAPTIPAYVDAFEWFFAELGVQRPHVAGNSMGGAIALELARRRAIRSATAFSPAGFWNTPELRFAQASLGALAAMPHAARPAVEALSQRPRGRVALFSQLFGYPARLPAEEALSTLRDAWASPALAGALAGFDEYRFGAARGTAEHAGHGRLGQPGPPAPLPDAGAACAPDAAMGDAPDARRGARSLLRRPGRRRRGDPLHRDRPDGCRGQRLSPQARTGATGRPGIELRALSSVPPVSGVRGLSAVLIRTSRLSGPPKLMLETNCAGISISS